MILLVFPAAYLIGSLPFALIAGYLITGEDIRKKGSGNAGATNVLRIHGWKAALPVLLLDYLKAFIPVFYAPEILDLFTAANNNVELFQTALLLFLILGHVFPFWAGFKGGKGVAAAAGGVSALFPAAVPFSLLIFSGTVYLTKYVSLASLLTAWSLPLYYLVIVKLTEKEFSLYLLLFFLIIALLITVFHRKNIKRLIKGEESKIGS